MNKLRRVFYVSRPRADLDATKVKDIVFRAQRANRQLDVTGVLAHSGRHFAQVLEGRADTLAALVAKIGRDPRHTDVRVVFEQDIALRDYADWSMGFLYNAALDDEIEQVLNAPTESQKEAGDILARRISSHVGDLANP